MDMLWGTRGAITLEDPLYDIFLHVMLHGSLTFSVADSRKLLIKLVGFRMQYSSKDMVENFKGLVSSNVKDCISKIMINGMLSYFMINANLFEISETVKERLDTIFDEYGIRVEYFNIETIEVPKEDYDAVTKAKERRSGRIIEGYTWQEERQMIIAEKFAGNEGTMGNVGGAVGGFMMGGALGGSIVDIAKQALSDEKIPQSNPAPNTAGTNKPWNSPVSGFDVKSFLSLDNATAPAQHSESVQAQASENVMKCPECGNMVQPGSKFCPECGRKMDIAKFCPECGNKVSANNKFCPECGTKLL